MLGDAERVQAVKANTTVTAIIIAMMTFLDMCSSSGIAC
jgi:hypothetical protein